MYANWQLKLPSKIIFGSESFNQISSVLKPNYKKALIVTDKVIEKLGIIDNLVELLGRNHIEHKVFDAVEGEPTDNYVEEGLNVFKESGCRFIIAIGGGSPIDTAKAISAMSANPGKISDYQGLGKVENKGCPLIVLPTTAGTGSEVTPFTIITDTKTGVKMLIGSPNIIPDIAIVDPKLTLSCPKNLTAAVGIDALTHAIEAYVSVKASSITDMFAISAIELISQNLRKAWANGSNLEARSKVMEGALKAGIAFGNSSVALVHGMSRPVGAYFHVAHGVSNAALLSAVMEFSYIGNVEKFGRIAIAMGEKRESSSKIKLAELAVSSVRRLISDIRIPSLKELGINKEELKEMAPTMAGDAIDSGSPANNPRTASGEEIIALYMKSYE